VHATVLYTILSNAGFNAVMRVMPKSSAEVSNVTLHFPKKNFLLVLDYKDTVVVLMSNLSQNSFAH